jgi:hypothetical protein
VAWALAATTWASTLPGIFPPDNPWNRDVSADPVHPGSDTFINAILTGNNKFLHADFGSNLDYGIPYVVVPGNQPKVAIAFTDYGDESDPGPYPVPKDAPVEGNGAAGDRHVCVLDRDNAILYEMYNAQYVGPGWKCSSGAIFDLKSNALRPDGWTSADAAGLPIFPGLVRYDDVAAGEITHALRFTVHATQGAYIHPATHKGSVDDPSFPPMGLRLRLKANFDLASYKGQALVILKALKKYGMLVADNGSDWFISGASDTRFNDDDLNQLKTVPGSAFEAVDTGAILGGSNSGYWGSGGGGTTSGSGDTNGAGGNAQATSNTFTDTDSDGFPDELEAALGTDSADPSSTPFGSAPVTPLALRISKLSIKLNFTRTGSDSLTLAALLPVPSGFSVSGQKIVVDVGGCVYPFELDGKGRHSGRFETARLSIRSAHGNVPQQDGKFTMTLTGHSLCNALRDEGLTNDNVGDSRIVPVIILFNQQMFRVDQKESYRVRGNRGMAQ